jgi:hypothetical protein
MQVRLLKPGLGVSVLLENLTKENTVNKLNYVPGHSHGEIHSLLHQGTILRPVTEHLLRSARIGLGTSTPGLGCDTGEFSILRSPCRRRYRFAVLR